jgi:serine/threonine protein phosphatase PrpC
MAVKPDIPLFFTGVACSGIISHSFATGTICLYTAIQPDKPTVNEDAVGIYACDDEGGVLVVADGMGGLPEGDKASAIAVNTLHDAVYAGCVSGISLRESILDGIEQANNTILSSTTGAATTLLAVEISDRHIRSYHVGDSKALVTGQRGKIKYQTIPHSPVGYAIESGLIEEDDAMHHEDRHIISNMVGSVEMRVEIGPLLALAKRDTLLLGSDGLYDNLTIDEIVDIIRCGQLEDCAGRLVSVCNSRMTDYSEGELHKPDDLSFILFRPV